MSGESERRMKDSSTYALEVTVNESSRELEVEASETLASVLRERLHLTGTKISCEEDAKAGDSSW